MQRITEYHSGHRNTLLFADFETRFLEICEAHRAQGRALAFAFILFDRQHSMLRRVLGTGEFWDSLDELSGRLLTIFSFDVRAAGSASDPAGDLRGMVQVEGAGASNPVAALAQHFEGIERDVFPCILFFQVDGAEVIDSFGVQLRVNEFDGAYRELEDVIGSAVDVLSRVMDENAENAHEIFNLVRRGIEDRRTRGTALRVWRTTVGFGELAGVIELLRLLMHQG